MKKIPLAYKIIIGALLLIAIISFLKPNIAKKLLKNMIGEYEEVDKRLKTRMDSLNSVRYKDSIYYSNALKAMDEQYDLEILEANEKYNWLTKKYRQNEKELDAYRHSSFDRKFELFSRAVIGKDTISR